jgi:hypothetical protein
LFEQAVIATTEYFGKNVDGHACKTGLLPTMGNRAAQSLFLFKVKWGQSDKRQAPQRWFFNGQPNRPF